MKCPDLQTLPLSPADKIGWPWTEESLQISDRISDGSDWPKISIVTPSFNQGEFIEETIRSVLLQGYSNLEYIIIDGGSTDRSVDIIRKYEPWLSYWISEPDRGQSHAINKGFEKSSGTILAWLNSDDLLKANSLEYVAKTLHSQKSAAWLVGASEILDRDGKLSDTRYPNDITFETILNWHENWFPQQSTFWNQWMWQAVKPIDESLHYVMDFALWLAMIQKVKPTITPTILSCYRHQPQAKCMKDSFKVWDELLNYFLRISPELKKNKPKLNLVYPILKIANMSCFYEEYNIAKKCLGFSFFNDPLFLIKKKNTKISIEIFIKMIVGRSITDWLSRIGNTIGK